LRNPSGSILTVYFACPNNAEGEKGMEREEIYQINGHNIRGKNKDEYR
jgi:hypothetical protein